MAETQTTIQTPSGQVTAAVRTYFATPLALIDLPGAEALNRTLKAVIVARMEISPGVEHSNLGGWQSSWDFTEWSGDAGRKLIDAGRALADNLTCDRAGQQVDVDWRVNAWANVNRAGNANEFHTHPGSYWSGCYYVDDGGIGDNPELGGEFELQDPRGVAPAMYAPLLAFKSEGGLSVGVGELVRPQAGRMILFPSWLSHGVRPYSGTGTRISIAFNLSL